MLWAQQYRTLQYGRPEPTCPVCYKQTKATHASTCEGTHSAIPAVLPSWCQITPCTHLRPPFIPASLLPHGTRSNMINGKAP
jgi:hypothetical protein